MGNIILQHVQQKKQKTPPKNYYVGTEFWQCELIF